MTEYICPNCRGGFPEPAEKVLMASGPEPEDQKRKEICPWCEQELGEYQPANPDFGFDPKASVVRGKTESKVIKKEDDEPKGGPLYQRLLGWLE